MLGNLVDGLLMVWIFTHTLLNGNAVFYMREVAFCAIGDVFKGNGIGETSSLEHQKRRRDFTLPVSLVYSRINVTFEPGCR